MPPNPRRGRMPVVFMLHGGAQGFADVLEGLVVRNARSIREGAVPPLTPETARGIRATPDPIWRDAVTSLADKRASRGTLVAWAAASQRVQNKPATVGFINGIPDVMWGGPSPRIAGLDVPAVGVGVVNRYNPTEGRVEERALLTLDDDAAMPVREINTAIARHNVDLIQRYKLPRLYQSKVRYETEGSPELWLDAKEIVDQGHDDCEGLAAYRAGELMVDSRDFPGETGRPLKAEVWTRYIENPTGAGRLFHAITRVLDPDTDRVLGFDDPSPRLGMPVPDWYKQYAAQMRASGRDL